MIRHVVLIRPRAGLPADRLDAIMAELRGLKAEIPGILAIEAGPNTSPEGLGQGFACGFTVDFADAGARDAYLPHPAHQRVGGMIVDAALDGVDGLVVVDFEV